jgi:hypothetical protein
MSSLPQHELVCAGVLHCVVNPHLTCEQPVTRQKELVKPVTGRGSMKVKLKDLPESMGTCCHTSITDKIVSLTS